MISQWHSRCLCVIQPPSVMSSRPCHTEHTPFSRLVHLLLLVGWLLSSQGVAPALCFVAAVMDGEHAVNVRASRSGDVSVVLSHEERGNTANPHHHEPLCALVVAFAQKPVAGEPDHVLAFKSVEDASRTLRGDSARMKLPVLSEVVFQTTPCRMAAKGHAPDILRVAAPAWSPGLEIKTGRMILRC